MPKYTVLDTVIPVSAWLLARWYANCVRLGGVPANVTQFVGDSLMKAASFALAACALLLIGAGRGHAAFVAAVNFTSALGPGSSTSDLTIGFSFSTNRAITIDALELYDPVAGGYNVRLYDGNGVVIISTTISSADQQGAAFNGHSFFYHAITPTSLAAMRRTRSFWSSRPASINWRELNGSRVKG